MPKSASTRTIAAPRARVWEVVADPLRLGDWWPGVVSVDPGRRGLVAGARWRIEGEARGRWFRRPLPAGELLVLEVETPRRVAFQLTGDRIDAELVLHDVDEDVTRAELVVEALPLTGLRRAFAANVLRRLAARVEE